MIVALFEQCGVQDPFQEFGEWMQRRITMLVHTLQTAFKLYQHRSSNAPKDGGNSKAICLQNLQKSAVAFEQVTRRQGCRQLLTFGCQVSYNQGGKAANFKDDEWQTQLRFARLTSSSVCYVGSHL